MRELKATLIFFVVFSGLALDARGQVFRALGFLDPTTTNRYSIAYGISGDGLTVVGKSRNGTISQEAFRWTATAVNTLQPLGFLPGGADSSARGVSGDGSVVVGESGSANGSRAFRWASGSGMVSLGTLEDAAGSSFARDCSADGLVVVGNSSSPNGQLPFRWSGGTMVALELLPSPVKASAATAVSANGEVIAGFSGCCGTNSGIAAVRWVSLGAPESLEDPLSGQLPWSRASGISADGLVVVGGVGSYRAFRWAAGTMTEIGSLLPAPNHQSSASAASGDGSVVVGTSNDGLNQTVVSDDIGPITSGKAFIWTQATGMLDLQAELVSRGLVSHLTGWKLFHATGISDDGNIIAGYGTHNGQLEGWVAVLDGEPFPSSDPDPPDDDGEPVIPFDWLGFLYFGLHESHGFLWHPVKGPQPIDPDPPFILGPAAEGGARWVEGALGVYAGEQLWAVLSETPAGDADLRLLRHDGRAWNLDWNSLGPADALLGSRGFHLAFENQSGDALVVYETGAGTPRYQTYQSGAWSEERTLPRDIAPPRVRDLDEGIVRWIELAPRPGTDEIALAYVDERGNLLAWTWDGNRWLHESAALLANDLGPSRTTEPMHRRPFDLTYETLSGTVLAAWTGSEEQGFYYARKAANAPGWSSPVLEALPGLRVDFIDLASEPASDLVAGSFIGPGAVAGRRLGLAVWDSQGWQDARAYDDSLRDAEDAAPPAFPGAVGWFGTTRVAICIYAGREPGTLDWARWTADTGWSIQPDVPVSRKGVTGSVRLTGSPDGGLLALLSDSVAGLHALEYKGAATWQVLGDSPFAQDLASPDTLPFALALSNQRILMIGDPAPAAPPASSLGQEGTIELLSFALVPLGDRHWVEALAFTLEDAIGLARPDWSNVELVVDANANGTVDPGEITTVGGPGLADPISRLVFFERFEISAPTHYVLRAMLPALEANARVAVSLLASGVMSHGTPIQGSAARQLVGPGVSLLPGLSINNVTVAEGDAGLQPARFTARLTAPSQAIVTVEFLTADGAAGGDFAEADVDYVSSAGTLIFPPGLTSQTITVFINGDRTFETDENFAVILANPVNATIQNARGECTIRNDDPMPSLRIDDVTVVESNSGSTPATFTLSLSNPSQDPVSVKVHTEDGTARAGSDYAGLPENAPATVTFAPGVTSMTFTVPVLGDSVHEPTETFTVRLSMPVGATLADDAGQAAILNDDGFSLVTISINDASLLEGNTGTSTVELEVSLSEPSVHPVTVKFATADGTATAAFPPETGDYDPLSGSLTFAPGETSKTIAITIHSDLIRERDEVFTVELTQPINAVLADDTGVVTLKNDDSIPGLSIADAHAVEGDSGATFMVFRLTLSGPTDQIVTVNFATADALWPWAGATTSRMRVCSFCFRA